ncbi:hypothetical protein ACD591_10245 [Rufibacter glacialis]|uniref:Porin family protein n=1 Tax=Rufibacter glacialis TaxID=1259555 RepID=A0A5M8QA81_9BACT|nr:hypothetical protein [Rufibacter glacialis]KAA6431854.1 hypothetical protein FOE74_17235 [Rufibacter glacialis]GGK80994.1 hypothetical protein GCM10011405_30950 [Rufibacter glacialis]
MKKLFLLLLVWLLVTAASLAQERVPATPSASDATAKKYLGMVELGYLNQSHNDQPLHISVSSPTFTIFNGYQWHRLLAVGTTLGLDFYQEAVVSPLALGFRGTVLPARVSPFYSMDMGYGATFLQKGSDANETRGGFLWNPALGLRVQAGPQTAFAFSLGYKTQRLHTKITNTWDNSVISNDITYKRLSVRIGFQF